MKKYLPMLFLLVFAFSCKKKEKPQASTWTVNGETFTAIATPSLGKAISVLGGNSGNSRFSISFFSSYLPEGFWQWGDSLMYIQQNPQYVYMDFHCKGSYYYYTHNKNEILKSTRVNQKLCYKLTETWFVNYYNSNDSVLISGDFYEP